MKSRIIWLCIIVPYFFLFFYNRFTITPNGIFPLIFSYGLVGWLGFEFYMRNPFFQSGIIPIYEYPYWLRIITAVYFYGSFLFANFEVEKSGANPAFGLLGLVVMFLGIALRIKADLDFKTGKKKFYNKGIFRTMKHPSYIALALITLAMGLCYNSITVVILTLALGWPLLYLEANFEEKYLAKNDNKFDEYRREVKFFGLI